MPILPRAILGPQHLMPNVRTAADYVLAFETHIARGRATYPNLQWPNLWRSVQRPTPFVSGGSWKIRCATPGCQDFPLVSFEWGGLALCFACGALYERLDAPPDRAEIERVLLNRAQVAHRNFCWPTPETLDEARAENRAHGEAD